MNLKQTKINWFSQTTEYGFSVYKHKCGFQIVVSDFVNANRVLFNIETMPKNNKGIFHVLEHYIVKQLKEYYALGYVISNTTNYDVKIKSLIDINHIIQIMFNNTLCNDDELEKSCHEVYNEICGFENQIPYMENRLLEEYFLNHNNTKFIISGKSNDIKNISKSECIEAYTSSYLISKTKMFISSKNFSAILLEMLDDILEKMVMKNENLITPLANFDNIKTYDFTIKTSRFQNEMNQVNYVFSFNDSLYSYHYYKFAEFLLASKCEHVDYCICNDGKNSFYILFKCDIDELLAFTKRIIRDSRDLIHTFMSDKKYLMALDLDDVLLGLSSSNVSIRDDKLLEFIEQLSDASLWHTVTLNYSNGCNDIGKDDDFIIPSALVQCYARNKIKFSWNFLLEQKEKEVVILDNVSTYTFGCLYELQKPYTIEMGRAIKKDWDLIISYLKNEVSSYYGYMFFKNDCVVFCFSYFEDIEFLDDFFNDIKANIEKIKKKIQFENEEHIDVLLDNIKFSSKRKIVISPRKSDST